MELLFTELEKTAGGAGLWEKIKSLVLGTLFGCLLDVMEIPFTCELIYTGNSNVSVFYVVILWFMQYVITAE